MTMAKWMVGSMALALVLLAGCYSTHGVRSQYSSSVVSFLYPTTHTRMTPGMTHLQVPLRVGIAFVPAQEQSWRADGMSEVDRLALLGRIAKEFRDLPFVEDIEIIPSAYLRAAGGFDNLDQVGAMFNVAVITLVGLDQLQHTHEGLLSLSYWTIVGAYLVRGEKNDTSTMLDAAVIDIRSRKLLFRAPGISVVKGSSTPINLSEQLRKDSQAGYSSAADQLVINLREELTQFRERIKTMPEAYTVEHKPGYQGGAAWPGWWVLLLLAWGGWGWWRTRRHAG